ncbi:MAG: hypothetical protein ABSD59_02385 [Terracidiphilus sp.]|jgi:hypothetical protein
MLARSVVPIVAIVALQAGLVCNTGYAATGTASISVSVIVEAGCQVSPAGAVADSGQSGPKELNSPISVNCSLSVPYQVTVNSNPATDLAKPGSTIPGLADLRGFARAGDRNFLLPRAPSIKVTENSEYGLLRPVSLGSPAGIIEAARCSTEDANPGTMTVAIVY